MGLVFVWCLHGVISHKFGHFHAKWDRKPYVSFAHDYARAVQFLKFESALPPEAAVTGTRIRGPLCANNSHFQHRTLEHCDAGGGAVHSIKSGNQTRLLFLDFLTSRDGERKAYG